MKTVTKFPLQDLVKLPIFVLPGAAWNGQEIAYYSDQSGQMELWVVDIETGRHRQVSRGQLPKSLHAGFVWDRAGRTIVFAKDQNGDEQHDLWGLDLESREARPLTNEPNAQEIPIEFSPDDRHISFASTRNGQLNLFSVNADGSDVRQFSDFSNPLLLGGRWSPDGRQLTACVNETDNLRNIDVYLVAADGSGAQRIFRSSEGARDLAMAWSPDGKSLAITSDASGVNHPGILDLETGQVRWLGVEEVDETARTFSPDGKLLLALRNQDARLMPVIYETDRGAERVPAFAEGGSVIGPTDADFVLGGEAIVVGYSTDATRAELLLYDLEASETRVLVKAAYGAIDPSAFVMAEDVYYTSFDDVRIHGLLYRPHDIHPEERVPAIVMPHGGPTAQYFHGFDSYVQFLVNEGYVVLAPNIRGSTGYGVEFRDSALMDWGGADLKDIVAGREYLANLPFVDPDRIGIFGGSYGGYMTCMATTKAPEFWKAGIAWVGMTDLHALYDESMPHFKYYLR